MSIEELEASILEQARDDFATSQRNEDEALHAFEVRLASAPLAGLPGVDLPSFLGPGAGLPGAGLVGKSAAASSGASAGAMGAGACAMGATTTVATTTGAMGASLGGMTGTGLGGFIASLPLSVWGASMFLGGAGVAYTSSVVLSEPESSVNVAPFATPTQASETQRASTDPVSHNGAFLADDEADDEAEAHPEARGANDDTGQIGRLDARPVGSDAQSEKTRLSSKTRGANHPRGALHEAGSQEAGSQTDQYFAGEALEAESRRANSPRVEQARRSELEINSSSFAQELESLRRARSALKEGRAQEAFSLMRDLDQKRPLGALLPERRMTKVLALCALGKTSVARDVAQRLRDSEAGSLYASRLRGSCVGAGRLE